MDKNLAKIILGLFSVIIILSALSCEKSTEPLRPETNEILPLAVGNKWHYKEYQTLDDSLIYEKNIWCEVKGTRMVNDTIQVFLLSETSEYPEYGGLVSTRNILYRNEKDGLYWWGLGDDDEEPVPFKQGRLDIKYPISKDESWIHDQGDYFNMYTCVGTDYTIEVNAGRFRCIIIRFGYDIVTNDYWIKYYYSPGTGLIRYEVKDTTSRGIKMIVKELQSYELH